MAEPAGRRVYFMRHGISLWNRRMACADLPELLKQFGLDTADEAMVKSMCRCLLEPANALLRASPEEPPANSLDPYFVDPPLTLDGKRDLRDACAQVASALEGVEFDVVVVSPMLRTLQTATIAVTALGLERCQWVIDADAREHNHPTWIDTWGTADLDALRAKVQDEIASPGCSGEEAVCALRAPLQIAAVKSSQDASVMSTCSQLGDDGLEALIVAANQSNQPATPDVEAARREAVTWATVLAADPPFLHRPDGENGAEQLRTVLSGHSSQRWWSLDESDTSVEQRVAALLESRALVEAQNAFVVTHSMFIKFAMERLIGTETAWVGPATQPVAGELVKNGAIFFVEFDRTGAKAVKAGLYQQSNL